MLHDNRTASGRQIDPESSSPPSPRPCAVFLGHSAKLSGAELALLRFLPHLRSVHPHVVLGEDGPLVDRLRERGIDTEIRELPESAADVQRHAVSPRHLPFRSVLDTVAYSREIAAVLCRQRAAVVHTNTMKAHLYGAVASMLSGVPHVLHARDRAARDYLPGSAVAMLRLLSAMPRAFVANSHETLHTYRPRRNAHVVYDAAEAHRGQHTPTTAPVHFAMVGRLAPWKGQHVFLRAFAAAFRGGPERASIIGAPMFGEHDYERLLRDLSRNLGVDAQITFSGFVDDIADRLREFDALVHCSTIPEPFGQVVLEGMAAGLPTIAAAAGGPAEIVSDGRTGLLVPPDDAGSLASALTSVARDPDLRRRLGRAGRAASASFTPERVAEQLDRVYGAIVGHACPVAAPPHGDARVA